jgi:beta-mannosidase
LEAWDKARVENLYISPKQVTAAAAKLTAEVEVFANEKGSATIVVDNLTGKNIAAQRTVSLIPGSNRVSFDFVINRPSLWWPNGLGAHPLYTFRARLIINGRTSEALIHKGHYRSIYEASGVFASKRYCGLYW